jgi:hypothetical protein
MRQRGACLQVQVVGIFKVPNGQVGRGDARGQRIIGRQLSLDVL